MWKTLLNKMAKIPWINICAELKKFGIFLSPVLYAFAWVALLALAKLWLPVEIFDYKFLVLFTIVFLFLLVAKSTSWSIGHEKFGIKGDSRSRVLNYHKEGENNFWFDLFADNPDLLKNKDTQDWISGLIKKSNE